MNRSISERALELVLEKSRDNIMIADGNGVILQAGSNCAQIYGRSLEQMLGASIYELEQEGVLKPSVTAQVLQQRKPVQLMQATRTGRTVMAEGFPVFDEQEQLVRVISFSQDLTDLQLLQQEYELLQQKLARRGYPAGETVQVDELCFKSQALKEIYELLQRVAPTDASLLLLGESGVGKTAIAQLCHRLSPRAAAPFIEVNCSAIPESLFESEMFGYAPGSFTGASRQGKPGLIEQADGGTLFLDEVGELPLAMQAKLLKVLQDGVVTRIGSTTSTNIDFRLVSATNQNLHDQVVAGEFRLDLYYRLNVMPVMIPALRERPEDIPVLLDHVLVRLNQRYQQDKVLDEQARQQLVQYPWQGNVRELENLLERFYVASPGNLIQCELPVYAQAGAEPMPAPVAPVVVPAAGLSGRSLNEALDAYEKQLLEEALKQCDTTYQLAESLGLSQPTVFRRLRKHGLKTGLR
ncbi:sigma-54 interaction domain-containing protein [Neptuniibacter halophilus]|uniref:sigma-54 interaction domain-containing protein n=1 Tax=Neptuniibacter halophilus TaxID=651666 RepID=UPI0025725E19|nr:sigma 54-interacting transcriptional regulator [Neptuniibacter halophilus]